MIKTDPQGFLIDLDDWSDDFAITCANELEIELGNEHWEVIHLLRQFYAEFQLSPAMRILVKYTKNHLGAQKGNSIYLMTLFKDSPAKNIAKIAGLPKPDNCL
jgi:tRNA 2-thiouridine synthesizing protein E